MLSDWGRTCFYLLMPPIALFRAAMDFLVHGFWWKAALLLGCTVIVIRAAVLIAASTAAFRPCREQL